MSEPLRGTYPRRAPIDLRTVEAEISGWPHTSHRRLVAPCQRYTSEALLAALRATRAALEPFAAAYAMAGHHYDDKHEFGLFLSEPSIYTLPAFRAGALHYAAAVLASVKDD